MRTTTSGLFRTGCAVILALAASATAALAQVDQESAPHDGTWRLVIHGGAGEISPEQIPPDVIAAYRASLNSALDAGGEVLDEGGSAMDAVEAVLRLMEDDPLFNAGRGAVFTSQGHNELDASIMDGASVNAGAVAGVTKVRHPISLARAVLQNSPHVMLAGAGAESFAEAQGLELVEPSYFFTERRWNSLEANLAEQGLDMPEKPDLGEGQHGDLSPLIDDHRFGTVGAVALDRDGNLAAATSTGGTTGKRWGRVGDSPIIGAGTYAENGVCAVSATGEGEYFIRLAVAHEICARVRHGGLDIQEAADGVVHDALIGIGGLGGVIALGPDGAMVWSFNSAGMFRGRVSSEQDAEVAIFRDEG